LLAEKLIKLYLQVGELFQHLLQTPARCWSI